MDFNAGGQVAVVGVSLQEIGGHNMLEPAALGTAVVTGPHLHNFADIARQLRSVDAMCVGEDADAVGDAIEALLADDARRAAMAAAGMELVEQGRGARSEEHTSELQSLMRNSYAVFCLNKKKQ